MPHRRLPASDTATARQLHRGPSGAFHPAAGLRQQAFLWDTAAPGLGLRATSTGAKAYIFQARLHGRTVRQTIGSPEAWDIDAARAEARRPGPAFWSTRAVDPGDEKRGARGRRGARPRGAQAARA
ncbi:MAG: Arm DNA-binding domain-containing protein [Arhodomonas sp.]|nr:Arm DNA-binding domain-containing protein [Arhodomonas sp.]